MVRRVRKILKNMEIYNLAEIFLDNIYLALFLPLWIFLIIMLGRFFSVYVNKLVIYLLTLFSSFFGVVLCSGALINLPADKVLQKDFPFIRIEDFVVNAGLYVDKTALIFGLVLFCVSFFVQLFSVSYMKEEKKTYRFYALLNLFNFAMAGLIFSPNLFQCYIFWELIGVVSYLLIGFEYFKKEKSIASKKVFLMNRFGDTLLLGAIIICSYFIYSYAPNKSLVSLSFIDMNTVSTLVYAYASNPLFEIVCIMFLTGALVKSAQFPFYTWLQDAMEAKLPVSALLHSATLVSAGIFLVLRLMPFLVLESILLKLILVLGLLTTVLCSISACSQVYPKKVLAYSTSAQLGMVFMAIGMENIKAAIILFISHAFIKSLLFITLPRENEKWNIISFSIFLISGLSLSGLILSGFVAKEILFANFGTYGRAVISVIAFLTAFYIFRIALYILKNQKIGKDKPHFVELLAYLGLLSLNIIFYIYLYKTVQYEISMIFGVALFAWILVYILHAKNAIKRIPLLYPLSFNGFYLDKFYTNFCARFYLGIAKFFDWIDVRILSNYFIFTGAAKFGVCFMGFIENKIMNGSVSFIANTFRNISSLNLKAQNGNVQRYNAYAFIIITAILTCLIFGYTAMLIFVGG